MLVAIQLHEKRIGRILVMPRLVAGTFVPCQLLATTMPSLGPLAEGAFLVCQRLVIVLDDVIVLVHLLVLILIALVLLAPLMFVAVLRLQVRVRCIYCSAYSQKVKQQQK